MAAKIIDGEQIMWMRLQGNADAMHMLQTSHAFWVGPPLFGWGDFTLLSWANSKSLCNSTNMRLNCLFPWYLATFGTTTSPTLASQTFLKAGESFWAFELLGWRLRKASTRIFFTCWRRLMKRVRLQNTLQRQGWNVILIRRNITIPAILVKKVKNRLEQGYR